MNKEPIYLDTYVLQQDMRIRLPKSILNNLPIEKGITKFSIYLDQDRQELILRIAEDFKGEEK
ncbi:MAG: sucrose-6-phosphate hydrolase [Hungatella sp.]|nr:sucrose-6-phosphate hydrolase [Hungatella sp.]